ncbi:MAG TPA: hypothetical protein VF192_01400 [Longimicrobiales bacterium]
MTRFERIRLLLLLYCGLAVAVAAVSVPVAVLLLAPVLLGLVLAALVSWVLRGDAGLPSR